MQTDPNQNGAPNLIANNARQATLATFQSGQLLGLPGKLLNILPQREILIHDGVIKHEVAAGGLLHLTIHILPYQARRNSFSRQIAVDRVVTQLFGVIGKIGEE